MAGVGSALSEPSSFQSGCNRLRFTRCVVFHRMGVSAGFCDALAPEPYPHLLAAVLRGDPGSHRQPSAWDIGLLFLRALEGRFWGLWTWPDPPGYLVCVDSRPVSPKIRASAGNWGTIPLIGEFSAFCGFPRHEAPGVASPPVGQ